MTKRPNAESEDQLLELFDKLDALTGEGLQHGFYSLELSISTGRNGVREVMIDAGKKFRYLVRDSNLACRIKHALTSTREAGSSVRDPEERSYR